MRSDIDILLRVFDDSSYDILAMDRQDRCQVILSGNAQGGRLG